MKTKRLKTLNIVVLFLAFSTSILAQSNRNRDDDPNYEYNDRDYEERDKNRPNHKDRDWSDRNERYNNDRNEDRRNSGYDRYNDNDRRISDYRRGRYHFKTNPYDCRNFPNRWERMNSRRFDWYYFDFNNRYDPRNGFGNRFDPYFPWDPENRWDIRNRPYFYTNNYYWNAPRPNRIIIVPPSINFRLGNNNGRHHGHRR